MYLTIPVTSATSERVFSALRRLENYPRSTLLHCHKTFTDTLDTVNIACANEQRKGHFEKLRRGVRMAEWKMSPSPPPHVSKRSAASISCSNGKDIRPKSVRHHSRAVRAEKFFAC